MSQEIIRIKCKDLLPIKELEVLEVEFKSVMVNMSEQSMFAVLSVMGKDVACEVNSHESSMLTFAKSGCANNSHIKNIYQIHIGTMRHLQYTLKSATIEAKAGDIMYARLKWEDDKHRTVFDSCSVGDALILSLLSGAKLQIVKNVLDEMEPFNGEWDYEEEIID